MNLLRSLNSLLSEKHSLLTYKGFFVRVCSVAMVAFHVKKISQLFNSIVGQKFQVVKKEK